MENYHKLGNLVIWWFCVHVAPSYLQSPRSHCGGWDCGWNHEPFIYFEFSQPWKKEKQKIWKVQRVFFGGKKWDPSPHVAREKNLKSCLTLYIKKVSTCAHMDVGGQDDGTQGYL